MLSDVFHVGSGRMCFLLSSNMLDGKKSNFMGIEHFAAIMKQIDQENLNF